MCLILFPQYVHTDGDDYDADDDYDLDADEPSVAQPFPVGKMTALPCSLRLCTICMYAAQYVFE